MTPSKIKITKNNMPSSKDQQVEEQDVKSKGMAKLKLLPCIAADGSPVGRQDLKNQVLRPLLTDRRDFHNKLLTKNNRVLKNLGHAKVKELLIRNNEQL